MASYASVEAAGVWRDLANCPGRRVWRGRRDATVDDLVGPDARVDVYRHTRARDPVHVVLLDDGGLLSYCRADGTFVHTLNTPAGLARKLADLGIE